MERGLSQPKVRTLLPLVVAFLFAGVFLNSLDRLTFSVLKPTIKSEFGLDEPGYAFLINVFTVCYACAYIVSGWLVDWLGSRWMYALFIAGWSLAVIGGGAARTLGTFGGCIALLGLMEPGTYPVSMRVLTLWVSSGRRGVVGSIAGAGTLLGAIFAAPILTLLAVTYSWRVAFVVPGLAGLVLAVAWAIFYRDPAVAASTAPEAGAGRRSWMRLWRMRPFWGVLLARLVGDPVWYFCLFWMPGYFRSRGVTMAELGSVGWIPYLAGYLGGLFAGVLSDRLVRRGVAPVRARLLMLMGISLAGPVAMLTPHMPGIGWTIVVLSAVAFVCQGWIGSLGLLCTDLFPVSGIASMWGIAGAAGAVGAMLFNYSIGQITTAVGTEQIFIVMGCLHPITVAILFWAIRPAKSGAGSAPVDSHPAPISTSKLEAEFAGKIPQDATRG